MYRTGLYIGKSQKMGRGVFASRTFKQGDELEVCPLILLSRIDDRWTWWQGTPLEEYCFAFGAYIAIALGYGSLYNHSSDPNATYGFLENCIIIRACRTIKKDEQIFINYGYDEDELHKGFIRFNKTRP